MESQMTVVGSGLRSAPRLAAIVFCIFLGGATSVANGQATALSGELQDLGSQYVDAWNNHDPGNLTHFFASDADMIMGNGLIVGGRPAVETWWHRYFAVQEPERTLTIDVQETNSMARDFVLLNVRTTTGGRTTQGTELPARRARGTWLLVRQGSDRLISAMRGMPTEQDRIVRTHEQSKR
jgi:uncharacterized protein (TIGR02246 family)